MMLLKSIVPVALFAATAVADVTSINNALLTVTKDLIALNSTLANFSGDLFAAIPILGASLTLENAIKAGTKTANASQPLNFDDTLIIAQSTADLAEDATSCINTLISVKPKFDKLLVVTPITLGITKDLRKLTAAFATAIIAKVPANFQEVAKQLVQGIDDDFARGIKAYGGK
ncbi:hydrophobic surface binding protein A domain-containing protein [Pochonia chlamydosporia 170]|uniref:Hydrophobic surface binding protein A domain-containing protein n=1 Tax=Pochonia chlamydosporia 170 TaxID=1380566 RepID=A0A179F4J7_METCM|nr:hydrophobic surface binding protein A domain-containing protein [Pochonia chlamydosporia 170]OAQ60336.1 hydrophobic surface binding protein A domain-containing protein [Pochonia chlamydosporia 170]